MLDMSKLPSHKIENGIVIFDEPYKIDNQVGLFTFMDSIMECDALITDEDPTFYIHAFASSPEFNDSLKAFFKMNESKGWVRMYRSSNTHICLV